MQLYQIARLIGTAAPDLGRPNPLLGQGDSTLSGSYSCSVEY